MKKIIKKIYTTLGYVLCFFGRVKTVIKNNLSPVKEESILFVAHPDDDALFFHTLIKKEKPYVVLLTTGFSITRMKEFRKMMAYYGVRYSVHSLKTRDTRIEKLEKIIKKELENADFKTVYSHSLSGEYGHMMHKNVGAAVKKIAGNKLKTPVSASEIAREENKLSSKEIDEKINIFRTIYTSQDFVLEQYGEWVYHERITE